MEKSAEKKARWVVFISSPLRVTGRLEDFLKTLENYTPQVEYRRGCSAYLEFGLSRGGELHPLERLRRLRRDLARLGIPIFCGIGSNKFLARAAAALAGEGQGFWIRPEGEKDFLDGLAVEIWPGLETEKDRENEGSGDLPGRRSGPD